MKGMMRIGALSLLANLAALAPAAADEALLEAARQEGRVVVYGSWPAAAMAAISAGFKDQTGIEVEFVPLATGQAIERFLTELQTGRPNADVIQLSDLGPYIDFAERGLLASHHSAEYDAIPAQYKDAEGRWVILAMNAESIIYNTDLVAEADAPKGWQDLVNPAFAGRVAIPDATAGGTGYLFYYAMRDLYGEAFHDGLAALQPQLYVATAAQGQAVVSGEAAVAAGLLHYTGMLILQNDPTAPVALAWPEPLPLAVRAAAVSASAPRPNAGKLFMDYVASKAGQEAGVTAFLSLSPRSDVTTPGLPDFDSFEMFLVGEDEIGTFSGRQPELVREFEQKYLR